MITVWQLNAAPHGFAIITHDFRFWDFVAGAYEADPATALDPEKHLRSAEASIPFGLRTLVVPDEARPKELIGLAVVVYRQTGTAAAPGWSVVEAVPIDPLTPDSPLVGNIYIGGR